MSAEVALSTRILAAYAELKMARRDGAADWIEKAAHQLDDLLAQVPHQQHKENA